MRVPGGGPFERGVGFDLFLRRLRFGRGAGVAAFVRIRIGGGRGRIDPSGERIGLAGSRFGGVGLDLGGFVAHLDLGPVFGRASAPRRSRYGSNRGDKICLLGFRVNLKTQSFSRFPQFGQAHGRYRAQVDLAHEVPSSDCRPVSTIDLWGNNTECA